MITVMSNLERMVRHRTPRLAVVAGPGRPDPDWERALLNPAAVFGTVRAVLDHPRLTRGVKREILRRWAWDEYLKELAASEGMAEGEPSRLDEVRAALLGLDAVRPPRPSAPAAGIPCPLPRAAEESLAA